MRHIINYFRQCFCKHEWSVEESYAEEIIDNDYVNKSGTKVYMRCTKCGYHTNHWKFL
jgi:hypothetical protein